MSERIVVLGSSGAGKTTLARRLAESSGAEVLSLDALAFVEGAERRPLEDSVRDIEAFVAEHEAWVVEGCYGDLVEAALPHCTELVFLNPGVETCVEHCRRRPFEPDKYETREAQDAMLENLIEWVRSYDTRDDEFGLARHRRIFDGFAGAKRELTLPTAP